MNYKQVIIINYRLFRESFKKTFRITRVKHGVFCIKNIRITIGVASNLAL